MSKKEFGQRDIEIEAKLLEQEHRPTHLLLNYLRRKTRYPKQDDPRRKAVSKAIVWRLFFSPAVLAFTGSSLLAWATLWFMNKQTDIIRLQTDLLEEQNRKIEIQANLEEASRRNNLVLLMDNILNRVNDEVSENSEKMLSEPLIARIQALGQGFQPYKFLNYNLKDRQEKDSLGLTNEISPERGQLLLALVYSGINQKSMDDIYLRTSFTQSYLRKAKLDSVYLEGINLSYSDLMGAELRVSDLTKSSLVEANCRGAFFVNSIFSDSFMAKVNLEYAVLDGADFTSAYLPEANFKNAGLSGAILKDTYLEYANFINTDVTRVDFTGVKSLDSVLVHRKDWLIYIKDSLKLKGANELYKEYQIEAPTVDTLGYYYITQK